MAPGDTSGQEEEAWMVGRSSLSSSAFSLLLRQRKQQDHHKWVDYMQFEMPRQQSFCSFIREASESVAESGRPRHSVVILFPANRCRTSNWKFLARADGHAAPAGLPIRPDYRKLEQVQRTAW